MKQLPTLGFFEAIKLASSRILNFKGRSRRSEFWWWMLVVIIAGNIITMFSSNLLVNAILSILYVLWSFCYSPSFARLWKKCHLGLHQLCPWLCDSNHHCHLRGYEQTNGRTLLRFFQPAYYGEDRRKNAGEFAALSGISLIAAFFAIIVVIICLLDSTPGPNKYGESPKYVELSQTEESNKFV